MKSRWFIQTVLWLSGAVALWIGGSILLTPTAFYQSYQIVLPDSVELRNELRGSASLLLVAGAVMLAGALSARYRAQALWVALGCYGAFVAGRLFSTLLDGAPSADLATAWAVEMALLVLNGIALMLSRARNRV